MNVYERIQNICQSKGISITALCLKATGNKGNLSTWKNNHGHMRSDYLSNCADILDCTTDYILGRADSHGETAPINTNTDIASHANFENLSESQRAMLKCRINQLMINKFREENYFEDLNSELQVNDSYSWFMSLNDFSLDSKIPQMLTLLKVSHSSLFNGMNIVIKTKGAAQALQINFSDDAAFPILVSGDRIFNALSSLSISSLSVLDKEVLGQIEMHPGRTTSYPEAELRDVAKDPITNEPIVEDELKTT